jgi:hypothetical protein
MSTSHAALDWPDIAALTRGGDNSLGTDNEADPITATLGQALFWRNIHTEILAMEEAVLVRIHQLMDRESPQTRREVELTNVSVVVAQVERFRLRRKIWEYRLRVCQLGTASS